MKKLIVIMFVAVLLQQPVAVEANQPLNIIIDVFLDEGFTLDEWEVIMIDTISEKDFERLMTKSHNSYIVTVIKDKDKVKYIFDAKNPEKMINHSIQVIEPNHSDDIKTIQIVISGKEWNDSVQLYYNDLTKRLKSEYSSQFNRIFTCAKLNDNGIINVGFSYDEIWKKMKIVHKSEYFDNIQQSNYVKEVYGYTSLWHDEIEVQDEKINFQMAVKNDAQNKKQVIIGTPIILNEY